MRTVQMMLAAAVVSASLFTVYAADTGLAGRAGASEAAGARRAVSDAELKLRQDLRKVWSENAFWTRDYILAALNNQPDQEAALNRLTKNQDNIGSVITTHFGKETGAQLTRLLKDHNQLLVNLVKFAKAKDTKQYDETDKSWQKNGEDIADLLAKTNPNWTKVAMVELMRSHLTKTTNQVNARLAQKWPEDVQACDISNEHALRIADAWADGIIKKFPDKFSGG